MATSPKFQEERRNTKTMNSEQLLEVVYHGREERNIEYKQSVPWNNDYWKAKLTRTIIALSNIKDGGFLVIGVKDGTWAPEGMTDDHFNSFKQDDVQAYVNAHVKPTAQFTVSHVEDKGKKFVVIQVKEFDLYPVVCSKSGDGDFIAELHEGVFYIRALRMNESVAIKDTPELSEVIDLAVDKWQLYQLNRNTRAGLAPSAPETKTEAAPKKTLGDFEKWLK